MCPDDQHDGGEDEKAGEKVKRLFEFECPLCSANNPYDDGFGAGDEVRCYYCGSEFRCSIDDMTGKPKYREH
ncbi:MAG TPA: hypothetical protein PK668_21055 [Myxococcota bacterium]|nr:hypothetical protein [Myxococcota bacterium]HRY95964.1 hypothetical protein [Myxococcota bacterium]HSA23482.1 hypothetical protein [Myxococcota bacterium]